LLRYSKCKGPVCVQNPPFFNPQTTGRFGQKAGRPTAGPSGRFLISYQPFGQLDFSGPLRPLMAVSRPTLLILKAPHSLFHQPNPGFAASDGPEISTCGRQRHLDAFQAITHGFGQFHHLGIVRHVLGRPFAERSHERSPFDGEL
jgi:hypothetical protein